MPKGPSHLRMGDVTHLVGTVLVGVALALAVTAAAGAVLADGSAGPLALSALVAAVFGATARLLTTTPDNINFREAFATVTFSWLAVGIWLPVALAIGALGATQPARAAARLTIRDTLAYE